MLIDHQPWIALMVHSIDQGQMINNVAGSPRLGVLGNLAASLKK